MAPLFLDTDHLTEFTSASACLNQTWSARSNQNLTINGSRTISECAIASEDDLVTAAKSGDQQAFVELCKRYSAAVKRRILSIVRNEEDTEDALQDTLLRAYVHLETFRRTCTFSTWITSIGINTALMILRKRKTRKEVHPEMAHAESGGTWEPVDCVSNSLDPEGMHFKHQVIFAVRREVKKLRPCLREAIEQYYGTECSLEDSARALEVPVSTAKSRLNRGRSKLRRSLSRRGIFNASL